MSRASDALTRDHAFQFVIDADARLRAWSDLAAGFLLSTGGSIHHRTILTYFLNKYLPNTEHQYDPEAFMSADHDPPDFYEHRGLHSRDARVDNNRIHAFLNYVRRERLTHQAPASVAQGLPKYRNPVLMRSVDSGEVTISEDRDQHFFHITDLDATLELWRAEAAAWPKSGTQKHARLAIDAFLLHYIRALDLDRDPVGFLLNGATQPDFWTVVCPDGNFKQSYAQRNNAIHYFLEWLSTERHGVADEYGVMHPHSDFHNPVPRRNFTTGAVSHSTPGNHSSTALQGNKEFTHLLELDPALEEWRRYAMRWVAQVGDNHHRRTALNTFFKDFIVGLSLPRDPIEFFDARVDVPEFWGVIQSGSTSAYNKNNLVHSFLEWALRDARRGFTESFELRNPVSRRFGTGGQNNGNKPRIAAPHGWGAAKDAEFNYFLSIDPKLEAWRKLAADYHKPLRGNRAARVRNALNIFVKDYVVARSLPRDPIEFFKTASSLPPFWEVLDRPTRAGRDVNNVVHAFLQATLENLTRAHGTTEGQLHNPVAYRNKAQQRGNQKKLPKAASDFDLDYLVEFNPKLAQWKEVVQEWLDTPKMRAANNLPILRVAINTFLMDYISGLDLETDPREFLIRKAPRATFGEFTHPETEHGIKLNNFIHRLCDWLVTEKFAIDGEAGVRRADKQLYNPVPLRGRNGGKPQLNKRADSQFFWVEHLDRSLEAWRVLAAEWFAQYDGNRTTALAGMGKFLELYIYGCNVTRDPFAFLLRSYRPTESFEQCLLRNKASKDTMHTSARTVAAFLDWVLEAHLMVDSDVGARVLPHEFHNPIKPSEYKRSHASETYRETLPFEWLKSLQDMLTPGSSFRDLKWAHTALGRRGGGDWYKVDEALVDKSDPDCVFEVRRVWESGEQVKRCYIWSPVRTVALLLKLILPLRTFQVRFLESGEGDTWRYHAGSWDRNQGSHATGTERKPTRRGVFRRLADLESGTVTTGFYINTNKTADTFNENAERGYVIPWQKEDALYWLEKLRNWQEKYNPVEAPIPWTSLEPKHLNQVKPRKDKLLARGESFFLFRDAAADRMPDRLKPIASSKVDILWDRLLARFERDMYQRGETLPSGERILFVDPTSGAALFPLHNLRVSLITAYALRGKVPFPILSKLVAGHASIIMTLYYTKVGNAYLTEAMRDAERRIGDTSLEEVKQFLHSASERQLLEEMVFVDRSGVDAATSMRSPAAFRVMDFGICPRNGAGCHEGGEAIVDNSNQITFAPVPGYPTKKNCARCRFFITGPAFLPALEAHCNALLYESKQAAKRLSTLNYKKLEVEDRKATCLDANELFVMSREEESIMHNYEALVTSIDGLLNDLVACTELIARCVELVSSPAEDGVKLLMPGGYDTVRWAFEAFEAETEDGHLLAEARQLQLMCENAEKYSFVEGERPALQRARLIDAMLLMNNLPQLMVTLPEEDLLQAGNHFVALLKAKAGTHDGAIDVLAGLRRLSDIGIIDERSLLDGLQRLSEPKSGPARSQMALAAPGTERD